MSRKINSEISNPGIIEALAPFGILLSDDQVLKVREYIQLLLKWNRLMNLTSVVDPVEIVSRHFGESLFAATLLPVENGRLADVGSGAGFPGLALKIVHPHLHVTLIESNKKKSAFLSEVTRSLNLSDVEVSTMRFEEIRPGEDVVDFVTARAVGGFPGLLRWAKTALSCRGHLLLWAGAEDVTSISNAKGWIWNPPARIPGSLRRYLLVGCYLDEGR